jgi:nicotinamidase-related amidase
VKLPNTGRERALIVIDLQPAFIKPHNKHIISRISSLIQKVQYDAYIEAVFYAEKGSLWDTQQGYTVPRDENMRTVDEVSDVLQPRNPLQVVKTARSTFKGNQDLIVYLKTRGIKELHLVGLETHDCVLATAYDAFTAGYPVYALEECCESGTPGRHDVGLTILRWQNMTNNSCRADTIEITVDRQFAIPILPAIQQPH